MSEKILNIFNEEKEKYFESLKEKQVFVDNYTFSDSLDPLTILNYVLSFSFGISSFAAILYLMKDILFSGFSLFLSSFIIVILLLFIMFISIYSTDFFLKCKKYKKFKKNKYQMNDNMISFFEESFNKKTISKKLQNQIKIYCSMNEYKFLLGKNNNLSDLTYNDIQDFLSKRESINQYLEKIEQEKYMLSLDEDILTQKETVLS